MSGEAQGLSQWQSFIDTLMDPDSWTEVLGRTPEERMRSGRRGAAARTPNFSLPEPDPEKEGKLKVRLDRRGLPVEAGPNISVAPDEPEPDAEVGGPNCCRFGEPV